MALQNEVNTNGATTSHYKDWPNAAGFNALEDHRENVTLQVTGKIPSYAAGVLYRTGPGGYKLSPSSGRRDLTTGHWFDGYTVIHRFEILPTIDESIPEVTYRSYAQVDELIERVRQTGRREDITFGSKHDPCDGLFRKAKAMFFPPTEPHSPHDANIGVVLRDPLPRELASMETGSNTGSMADRHIMTVTVDAVSVKHFDGDTLEPLGVTDQRVLHPSLKGQLSAAHAAHDPVNGDIFNYNLHLGPVATYKVFRASPSTGEVVVLAKIRGMRGSYLHSMLITENYLILCVWPAYYKALGLSILYNRNILDAIETFDPKSARTKWFVIDRRRGRGVVKTFESSPFFCFHTVNAWEEKAMGKTDSVDIVCELVQYKDMSILHKFYYENMVSDSPGVADWNRKVGLSDAGLVRYKLMGVPSSGTAGLSQDVEELFNIGASNAGDLPRINPYLATKPHRYVWTAIARDKSSFLDGLVKTDTTTGSSLIWEHDKHTPSEPIFIPRPGATASEVVAEDDGIILAVILDGLRGTSYLLCLDAATMTELGRAEVGYPVGFGFHGAFVPRV